jgi:hypothetical protein
MKTKKVLIPIMIVVAAALVVCLIPLKDVAYAVTVDYEDTETYYEEEPYEEIEAYYEPLAYQLEEQPSGMHGLGSGLYFTLMNCSDLAGDFTFRMTAYCMEGQIPEGHVFTDSEINTSEKVIHLEPQETVEVHWSSAEIGMADATNFQCYLGWEILPEEVQRERTVTKYMQVEKQRTVTKQRQETRYEKVTLLEYLSDHSGE